MELLALSSVAVGKGQRLNLAHLSVLANGLQVVLFGRKLFKEADQRIVDSLVIVDANGIGQQIVDIRDEPSHLCFKVLLRSVEKSLGQLFT